MTGEDPHAKDVLPPNRTTPLVATDTLADVPDTPDSGMTAADSVASPAKHPAPAGAGVRVALAGRVGDAVPGGVTPNDALAVAVGVAGGVTPVWAAATSIATPPEMPDGPWVAVGCRALDTLTS